MVLYNEDLYTQMRSDNIIMENLQDFMMCQEGRDKIGYVDKALEALATPSLQAKFLNKLFKDIQKVEAIDFGKIPNSKGDLTKYEYYEQMYSCIDILNKMVDDNPTDNIKTLNRLHDIIINSRADFVFGFRTDNYILITTYNLMIASLYELINICAVDATEYLRTKLSFNQTIEAPNKKRAHWIVKTCNQFIKMHETGQWSLLMKTFKKTPAIATEAVDVNITGKISGMTTPNLDYIIDLFTNSRGGKVVGIIAALTTLFILLRRFIYYFFHAVGKLSDRLKGATTILRANSATENIPNAVEKQKKLLSKLEGISDVIDGKILKSEKAAAYAESQDTKANYNPKEITTIVGSDFDF